MKDQVCIMIIRKAEFQLVELQMLKEKNNTLTHKKNQCQDVISVLRKKPQTSITLSRSHCAS